MIQVEMYIGYKQWSLFMCCCIMSLAGRGQVHPCGTQMLMEQLWKLDTAAYTRYLQAENELQETVQKRASKTGLKHYTIPVVVHVMHNFGPENISREQVLSQIAVLNEDFRWQHGDTSSFYREVAADTRIRFCLARYDPAGNPTNGINRVHYPNTDSFHMSHDDSAMKAHAIWDPHRYLNIWVVHSIHAGDLEEGTQVVGYSYFPANAAGTHVDGIVVRYNAFGRTGTLANEHVTGRTTTHEVGHYLNLIHPWGNGNCNATDHVDDTPRSDGPFFSGFPDCPRPVQCGSYRMIENYMEYSDDKCMNMFTYGQSLRMQAAIVHFRAQLVAAQNLAQTGCDEPDTLKQVLADSIDIYPNPARSHFFVYLNEPLAGEALTVKVYDVTGKQVGYQHFEETKRGPYLIRLAGRSPGLHIVRIEAGDHTFIRKVMLTR